MNKKPKSEAEAFDSVMDGLLAVPRSELQTVLDKEKQEKMEKKEVKRKKTRQKE